MGFADGYYYGQGRIICDTSTFSVGDTIRVRSMTNTSKVWNQQVATVGTALVFTVPCYDYYKICMLQGGGHQITIQDNASQNYVSVSVFDGMMWTSTLVYPSITSGSPNSYNANGINLYFDDNSNKWVLKSTGTIVYQNQQYTSGQTIEEWSHGAVINISLEELPNEIGGVYKTVDYGQTLFIDVLDKHTLSGIQGILNAHEELDLLSIGDEVTIKVNGVDTVFQIGGFNLYDSHEVIFVAKYVPSDSPTSIVNMKYSLRSSVQAYMSEFYNNIDNTDRALIKNKTVITQYQGGSSTPDTSTHKIWLPTTFEVMGTGSYEGAYNRHFPIFTTQVSRVKSSPDEVPHNYMLASCSQTASAGYTDYINTNGDLQYTASTGLYLLPCFHLTADS